MLIYRVSHLSIISFLYALYRSQYTLVVVPGSVFLTSTLYWHKPDYSWRRYLDMAVTKTCFIYQGIMAYNAELGVEYYILISIAILFYPIGMIYYKKGDTWSSTYSHAMLHIIANLANVALYSSRPLSIQQLPAQP